MRPFSVPRGFSAARPSLTLVITATALIACTTAVMGTLLAAGAPGAAHRSQLTLESAAPVAPVAGVPLPPAPGTGPAGVEPAPAPVPAPAPMLASAPVEAADPPPSPAEAEVAAPAAATPPVASLAAPVPLPEPRPATEASPEGTASLPQSAEAAPAAANAKAAPPEGPYAGVWVTDEKACSPQLKRDGLIPALISSQGAWAGETTCSFRSSKRVGNTWTFAATCSDRRRRWNTTVRMALSGNRLTWTSQRGTQTYVRCHPGLLQAHSRAPSQPPA